MGLSGWSGRHCCRLRSVFWVPLVSSKLAKMLGFKGYLPLALSPTPRSKWELGQPLLSRERAKLREGVRQRNGIHPWSWWNIFIIACFLQYCHAFLLHMTSAISITCIRLKAVFPERIISQFVPLFSAISSRGFWETQSRSVTYSFTFPLGFCFNSV